MYARIAGKDETMFDERTTQHGNSIVDQIQTTDAYGYFNILTPADVWNILDNLHTHFLDQGVNSMLPILTKWMEELEELSPA